MRLFIPLALLFTALGGAAKNFETLAVCRFLASLAISPAGTVSVGIVNNLWDVALFKTGTMLALTVALMNLLPAAIGPSTGAALVATTGDWRWTFWLNAIVLGAIMLLTFPVPETYQPYRLKMHNKKTGEGTAATTTRTEYIKTLRVAFTRPVHMLFTKPIFFEKEQGLAFLPILGGNLLGIVVIGICDKCKYQKARQAALATSAKVEPELRLHAACARVDRKASYPLRRPTSLRRPVWPGPRYRRSILQHLQERHLRRRVRGVRICGRGDAALFAVGGYALVLGTGDGGPGDRLVYFTFGLCLAGACSPAVGVYEVWGVFEIEE
ncbi:uncharacterized protein DSM5745_09928 [Aspergillus mulundensis]|uniref:Major facilitator superfamily (MFS) profile domain-containing protein n=1 Tax=Aspergillus mulundensis TaxID=1810919 RepID=A0A3D8QRW0_9EURO|nr:hypothetical protein DSM5745_09928 [Aspergillus mulundensis]RDW64517.1 hypothetical protein DSM5745_09928 [Aspergillus mulundensis]